MSLTPPRPVENRGGTRETGFTTLADGRAVYRYTYVMPPRYDFTVTVRF